MKVDIHQERIDKILDRGVIVDVLPTKKTFREVLLSGKKLRFYHGIDPTGAAIHLGHAQNFILLEEFRALGHEVIVLVGDFTARIGDPSGRTDARKPLSEEEVRTNVSTIVKQIGPLINFSDKENPARLEYNSTWLGTLSAEKFLSLASLTTLQQLTERSMVQERLKSNLPLALHEFLYPLLQGYDSVALEADVELGGQDQTFNMLMGRKLMERLKKKEKFVVATKLLENPKTGELMSKSKGTGVMLGGAASDLFGQIMAQPDEMIEPLTVSVTRLPLWGEPARGVDAKERKLEVAREITAQFFGKEAADKARDEFERVFSAQGTPHAAESALISSPHLSLLALLRETGLATSNAEARRLIEEGAVEIDGKSRIDPQEEMEIGEGFLLRVGKHRFIKIRRGYVLTIKKSPPGDF